MIKKLKLLLLLSPVSIFIAVILVTLFYRCGLFSILTSLVVGIFFAWRLEKWLSHSKHIKYVYISLILIYVCIALAAYIAVVSANDARSDGGPDSQVKMAVGKMRSLSEVFYNNNGLSYVGFCDAETSRKHLDALDGIQSKRSCYGPLLRKYFEKNIEIMTYCDASEQEYAVSGALTSTGEYWCVDASGFAGHTEKPESGVLSCVPTKQ